MKKKILYSILLLSICLFNGCSMESTIDKAKNKILLYNKHVEKVLDGYEKNFEIAEQNVEDLKEYFLTLQTTETLTNNIIQFESVQSFCNFLYEISNMSEYAMLVGLEDLTEFYEYIKGFEKDSAEVVYYMDTDTGNLEQEITYHNKDSRLLRITLYWQERQLVNIEINMLGQAYLGEEYETFRQG